MKILVTGAGGFLGRGLVARLLGGALAFERLTLWDSHLPAWSGDGVRLLTGDLRDPAARDAAFEGGADLIFHLASVPSGRSEEQPALSRAVNLDAMLALLDAAAAEKRPPRVVFASSIAALGRLGPAPVDDDTPPRPALTYGAHKLMGEVALADMSRRGLLDGVSLRPAGILARPPTPTGQRSAFLSEVFHALKAGRPFAAPVGEDATSWLISRAACVEAFLAAAAIPANAMPPWRSFTLPALRVRFGDLAAAAGAALGRDAAALVRFEPDEAVEANFGRYPPLTTRVADELGLRSDGSLEAMIASVLGDLEPA
ncbi:MAG: NAD-dependent epimerase/dehydratase family protein [Caulobacteraceae bacterium]